MTPSGALLGGLKFGERSGGVRGAIGGTRPGRSGSANLMVMRLANGRGGRERTTAYFTVGGFGLLREGLESLGDLRLILAAEPR